MQEHSRVTIENFINPRNVGRITGASGIGISGNPNNGPFMVITIEVVGSIISDAKFKTHGCPIAVACGSVITELVKSKSVKDAGKIEEIDIVDYLGGIKPGKEHCPKLAVRALRVAIKDWERKSAFQEG